MMKQLFVGGGGGGGPVLLSAAAARGRLVGAPRPGRGDRRGWGPGGAGGKPPRLELYLDTHRGHTLSMTVVNRSGLSVESGGSVDQDAALYLDPGWTSY